MTVSSVLKTLSVATFATTAAVSMVAPAEALTLNGSLSLSGNAMVPSGVNPDPTTIEFNTVNVGDLNGDFAQVLTSPIPTIQDLVLNQSSQNSSISAEYEAAPTQSFINFGNQTINGVTSQLTFDLLSASFTRTSNGTGTFVSLSPSGSAANSLVNGVFQFNGETIANGFLTAQLAGDADTYSLSLSTEPVPEPFTILGSLSALGAGTLMKKQHDKRQNQVKSDA